MSRQSELAALGRVSDTGALSNRNLIINGAMQVAQRGTSFTGVTNTQFALDRFQWQTSAGPTVSLEQSTDAPTGFNNSFKTTVTTTDTVISTDYDAIFQPIEGLNFSQLGFGTSWAKQFTLSFWVKASVTGTYAVNFINSSNTRCFTGAYSVTTANTWEYKTIVVEGDTSGTWLATNGIGLKLWFSLGSGSDYQASSASTSWSSTLALGLTGAVDLRTTSGATFQITGVQLEVGDTATEFEHRSYGDELARCQRYYETGENMSANGYGNTGTADSGAEFHLAFAARKRATPSMSYSGVSTSGSPSGYSNGTKRVSASAFSYWYRHGGGTGPGNLQVAVSNWYADAEL